MASTFQLNSTIETDTVVHLKVPTNLKFVVMIPTYKRLSTLREAVQSCLDQGLGDSLAVIIVDNSFEGDDALDHYVKSIKSGNVALVRNRENLGMIGNWNRCVELSPISRLIVLHDDDLLAPHSIKELYRMGWNNRAFVSGNYELFGTSASRVDILANKLSNTLDVVLMRRTSNPHDYFYHNLFSNCPVSASGLCMDKFSALEIGGYYQSKWPITDYDFCLRYIKRHGLIRLKQVVLHYRIEINASSEENIYIKVPSSEYVMLRTFLVDLELNRIQYQIVLAALKLRLRAGLLQAARFRLQKEPILLWGAIFHFERFILSSLVLLLLRVGFLYRKPVRHTEK